VAIVGQAEVRIVADARGFARDAEREINNELRRINVDVDKINRDVDVQTRAGFVQAARNAVQSFGIIMQGGISVQAAGAFGISVLAALVPAVITAGTLAAGALVSAFGAGLAGIGIAVAAQNEEVQASFTALKDHVLGVLTEIAVPFEDTLIQIAAIAQETFDALAPSLGEAFEQLAPAITTFAEQVGEAFETLEPAIQPIVDAFIAILEDIGPRLKDEILPGITEAITNLADSIAENPEAFGDLAQFLFDVAEAIINLLAELNRLATWFQENPAAIIAALVLIGVIILALTGGFLGFVAAMIAIGIAIAVAWEHIQAAGDAAKDAIIDALATLGVKLNALKEIWLRIWGNITDAVSDAKLKIGQFLQGIGQFFVNLGIAVVNGFVTVREGIRAFIANAISNLQAFPGKVAAALAGIVSAISSPFRTAAGIVAGIVGGIISTVRGLLNTIGNIASSARNALSFLPGLQHGGIVERAGPFVVGEAGPELLFLPRDSQVVSNADSRKMLAQGGGRGDGITIQHLEITTTEGNPFPLQTVARELALMGS
jgi:phage-related protein